MKQLRLSRRDPRPDIVLGHLLDILPLESRVFAVSQPFVLENATTNSKPLPPVSEIVEFCEDFDQDVRQALLQHMKILLQTPFSEKISASGVVDVIQSYK